MELPANLPVDTVLVILYHYLPNKAAAIAALVLYGIVSIAVTAISVRTRCFYMLTVAVTGFLEVAGWATRVLMLSKPEMNLYIVHQALLIISPVLLAIVEYITLGKLLELGQHGVRVSSGGSKGSFVTRPSFSRAVKWAFTLSDVFCLLLQSTGGALYANPDNAAIARVLLLIGLGAQLAFFTCFIALTVYVQCSRHFGFKGDRSFRPVFICLYATTLLMHLRNSFRVAEFAQGFDGDLTSHEHYLFIFDFMPIYGCFLFFTVMHYGFWLGPHAPALVNKLSAKASALPVSVPVLHIHCT